MGHTLNQLSKKEIDNKSIFNNRFCVEVAEKIHFHYRNLRLNLSLPDFLEICQGMIKAFERWEKRGNPEPQEGVHIELCRRKVAQDDINDGIQVNYNKNLYNANEDKIYAEGAGFDEDKYIHLKVRDIRLELSVQEFKVLAEAVHEAQEKLEDVHTPELL